MIERTITMQEASDRFKSFPFYTMNGDGFNQDTMDDTRKDKILQDGGDSNQNISDVPVDVLSVPTKAQDGNADFQYEVSPTPAPLSSNQMGSSYYISPMPPTPSTDLSQTPSSSFSKGANTLAALYHSSRRSRHDGSPMHISTNTVATVGTSSTKGFLPPPPLATASPKPELTTFNSSGNNAPTSSNENWSTSVDSMTGFVQAPSLYNYNSTDESQAFPVYKMKPGVPQAINFNDTYLTPLVPAKQTVPMSQFEFTPSTTMDRQLLDLANESSANMLSGAFEQLPKFTRSRTEFEGQDQDTDAPSSKKQKSDTNSYNVSEKPTPDISPLGDDVEESILSLLALSKNECPLNQEVVSRHEKEREEAATVKRKDLIRRKVRRLLLIRHATRCKVPLPTSEYNANGSNVCMCPVSSHCADGKRLASHIRKCRDVKCQYKWCLTTRDVLSHYKSCRDRKCEICGPVRAMHRREEQAKVFSESNENNEERLDDVHQDYK
jgi:hypothetical protein